MNTETVDNHLKMLAGEWVGEETIAASKWGPGGKAAARISARLDLGGRALIQDYSAERDSKPWLSAHAVFAFDEASPAYKLYWFDSFGFLPTLPAPGRWEGDALIFIRSSPRGMTRHTYVFPEPQKYRLILESSFDGGTTWLPVTEGHYSKVT